LPERDFSIAILTTIFSGLVFFVVVISAVSFIAPWQSLDRNQRFPTAVAFESALHAHWIVVLVMGSALVALVQAFNANVVASSRLLFAMSRRNLLNPRMSRVHPRNQTPTAAIICVGIATTGCVLLGEAVLVPILEVGAVSAAVAWMAACASFYKMRPRGLERAAAIFGLLVTTVMISVKVLPWIPGHFTWHEWLALAIWALLGAAVRATRQRDALAQPNSVAPDLTSVP